MNHCQPSWAIGLGILRDRQARSASVVLDAFGVDVKASVDFTKYRSVITTGLGSSFAHAAYLAYVLRTHGRFSAWEVPTGTLLTSPRSDAREQALVVFSQGLSPNARPPLAQTRNFGCTVLVTAARRESGERSEALRRAEDAGVVIIEMPAAPEYEVLLRILGPLIGYAVALRIAAAQPGVALNVDANAIATAITDATERTTSLLSGADRRVFSDPITFVTTGGYGVLTSNLCGKVLEGMFLQAPIAVDADEFAHGTLQEAAGKNRTFIALSRTVPHDAELLARVRSVLESQHRWLEMHAHLPEPFQIFEHEAAMNVLVLNAIADRRLDQKEWPGKGQDGPLYSIASVEDLGKHVVS